jgi:hypothetical protein
LAVLGAATAEPARRRVLASVRIFILIGEKLELKDLKRRRRRRRKRMKCWY